MQKGVFLDLASLAPEDLDLSALQACLPDWNLHEKTRPEERLERMKGAQVVVSNKVVLDGELLRQLPDLKLICVAATGTNNIDLKTASEMGIVVSNVRAYGTDSVAQHVIGVMLAHFTSLFKYTEAVKRGDWSKSDQFCLLEYPVRELRGMTIGIVGYGELGQGVARLAEAFGMRVLIAQRPGGEPQVGRVALDELLPQVDVLSLHVPLTDSTKHLIDRAALEKMPSHALLVNAARGPVVDNAALADALREGVIGGAALDVVDIEPPPEDYVLLQDDIPNLIITPHTAWAGRQARQNTVNQIQQNIEAFIAGEPRYQVN